MKKFIAINTVIFLLGLTILVTHKASEAQSGGFGNLIPFAGNAGWTKFFDRSTGTVYVYDRDFMIVEVYQLEEVGKSFIKVK